MAKIAPKGSKVTGTKKKDKITWVSSKAWKKALTVNAGSGNDLINFKKSKYKNKLNGQNGNDTIYGGTKYDTIHGNAGNDKLYGYNGNDKIYGDSGKDTIYGGNNNDYINGGDSDDKLYGQNGNDTIYAGKGNDYIDGGNNNDKIYGNYGTNTLKGGAGNDSIYGGTGADKIYAGSGNDYVNGGNGNDIIYGESGTNNLNGGAGNDTIYSGTGSNTINGGAGSNYIDVTKGTNKIIIDNVTANWDNIIMETVAGFKNSDTLQINTALYYDGIMPKFLDSKNRDLYFGYEYCDFPNIRITDYSEETRNGFISVNGAESIRISELLANYNWNIYDDEVNNLSNITLPGSYFTLGGNDIITNVGNNTWNRTYLYTGTGDDSITNVSGQYSYIDGEDGNDTITTSGAVASQLFLHGGDGNDSLIANDSGVNAFIYGEDGNDIITGGWYMSGGAGNDTITSATTGNHYDISNTTDIDGGEGDDEIHVYSTHLNPIIYMFAMEKSDGNDTIYDDLVSTRRLRFAYDNGHYEQMGTEFFDTIKYAKCGNDLIIRYQDTNSDLYRNSITIKDFLISENQNNLVYEADDECYTVKSYIDTHGFEEIIGTDADEDITGTDNNDILNGMGGSDTLTGGLGNDTLIGGAGNNTYIYNDGDGTDEINTTSDTDVLQFNDYNETDIYYGAAGNTLILHERSSNDCIIALPDFLDPDNITRLNLKFANGTTKDIFDFLDNGYGGPYGEYHYVKYNSTGNGTDADEVFISDNQGGNVTPGKGNDRIYVYESGAHWPPEFTINAGDGNDILYQKGGKFNIKFADATLEYLTDDNAWQQSGNDLLIKYDGVNTLTIKDYFTSDNNAYLFRFKKNETQYDGDYFENWFCENPVTGTEGTDSITGSDNNDLIRTFGGDDIIEGGKGNDILIGGAGTNTYIFSKGDGHDKIVRSGYDGIETNGIIKFNDVGITELNFDYIDNLFAVKYGDDDYIKITQSNIYKIIDKTNNEYNCIFDIDSNNGVTADQPENYLIVGRKNNNDAIRISNANSNSIIIARGGDTDYYKDNIQVLSGTALVMVAKQDSYTSLYSSSSANTTVQFTDTTLDNVYFSLEPLYTSLDNIMQMDDYLLRLRFNSGESYLTFSETDNEYHLTFSDITLKDYTGTSTTLAEYIGYQNGNGIGTLTGTGSNNVLAHADVAYGKGGNDIIWGCKTAYGYDAGQKNTTEGSSARIFGSYKWGTTMYAQSETNVLIGDYAYGDTYYAYIDQKTTIYDRESDTSYAYGYTDDILNFTNTSDTDKDGQLFDNLTNKQIHVLFNVSNTYNREVAGAKYAFGDVTFVDNDGLELWASCQEYKGITIRNNSVDIINTTDGYTLTNTDIADLAGTIASWLTSDDRNYGSVNDVLASNNETDITALIAQFDNANWQSA